jgi:hypothetical protein
MRPAADGLNDYLDSHLVRLRFFRALVLLGLVLLGLCCLQLPFVGRAGRPPYSVVAQQVSTAVALPQSISTENTSAESVATQESNAVATTRQSVLSRPEWQLQLDVERAAAAKAQANHRKLSNTRYASPAQQQANGAQQAAARQQTAKENAQELERNLTQLTQCFAARSSTPATRAGKAVGQWVVGWTAGSRRSSAPVGLPTAERHAKDDRSAADQRTNSATLTTTPPGRNAVKLQTSVESAAVATALPLEAPQPSQETPLPRPTQANTPPRLTLVNPAGNRLELTVVVDGRPITLPPGKSHQLMAERGSWLVQFHRGGDFGDATFHLTGGAFAFASTAKGWSLTEVRQPAAPSAK